MKHPPLTALALCLVALGVPTPSKASEEPPGASSEAPEMESADQRDERGPDASAADTILRWSLTPVVQFSVIPSPESDNDVAGFFDQYQFTPNKGTDVPFEIGLRDGALDIFDGDETPRLQLRLESPSSNLGISGTQIDDPLFNQRLIALTRLDGIDLDLRYRRMRTEQLRLFPNTAGAGLVFNDFSDREDRFYRDRTGFEGEIRVRPERVKGVAGGANDFLAPELSLRGRYQSRDGRSQTRFLHDPSNTWFGFSQKSDREVAAVGGGVLVSPKGLFTLSLDFDHERLRFDSKFLSEGALGFGPPSDVRPIGFVPDSNRYTGSARVNSRIGDRVVFEGGFQVSELQQVNRRSPEQSAEGMDDVEVRYYSANAALDLRLSRDLSVHTFFKLDRRENDTSRSTNLFNPNNQIVPVVDDWERFLVGGELEFRLIGLNRVALGVRYEDVKRDLDFAQGALRIFPGNALIRRDSESYTFYGRTALRPLRGMSLNAELGYREAPETGYVTELDNKIYGELRATQVFSLRRPLVLSAYAKGSSGENRDFRMVSAQGAAQTGPELKRSHDRWNLAWGVTASHAPVDRLQMYASVFYGRDEQDSSLDLSNFQRYFQNQGLVFARGGHSRLRNRHLNLTLGSHIDIGRQTDARLGYTYTQAKVRFADAATPTLDQIQDNALVDAEIHGVDFELRHQVRPGLRIFGGYRYRRFDDNAPGVESLSSAARPFDRSTHQHTVSLGVTLTSEFLSP